MTITQKANKILGYDDDREHEFWKSTAPKVIVKLHQELVGKGLNWDEAANVISGIWDTASEEYGN